MRIHTKLALLLLPISLFLVVVISISSFYKAKAVITQQILNQLESVASIQQHRIDSIISQNLERLVLVSSRTQLRLSLESFIKNPKSQHQKKMNRILHDARSSIVDFRNISILTPTGQVAASTDTSQIGTKHAAEAFFIRGQKKNNVDIFFLDEQQNVRVYLSGPLYLEDRFLGVVVVESNVDNIISSISDYSGLGKTGETLVATKDKNGDALFLTPLRFDRQAALRRTLSKDDLAAPITQALLKKQQFFTAAIDYRGKPVLAATRYIEKVDWGLVVKMDTADAFAPIVQLRTMLVFIIIGTSVVVILVSVYTAWTIARPINQLTQAFARAGKGDYTQQLPPTSIREFSRLADGFSSMLKEISAYQHKLHESEKHFRELVETANTIPWRLDLDTWRFTYVGPQAVELLGYPVEDWYAEGFWPDHLSPDDREQAVRFCQESTARCEDHEFEYRMVAADGRAVWIRDSVNVVSAEGGPKMLRGFMFDITARKQAEEELQKHRVHLEELVAERTAELEVANRELEAFSYSVSHDLRTPLRGIDGFSLALLEDYQDQLDDTGKDHLQRVRAASQRMGELIDDMLMLSKVSRAEMRYEPVDLGALAHEISTRLQENEPNRRVEIDIQESLTDHGDAHLLRIVLDNLLGNAWKFTSKQREARIEVGYTEQDGKGVYYVRDSGVGFDMQYADKLFGAFQRLHSLLEFEGSGIGLVTVQRIIHRHGGRVWAEAEENKGATFYFTIRGALNGTKNHTTG